MERTSSNMMYYDAYIPTYQIRSYEQRFRDCGIHVSWTDNLLLLPRSFFVKQILDHTGLFYLVVFDGESNPLLFLREFCTYYNKYDCNILTRRESRDNMLDYIASLNTVSNVLPTSSRIAHGKETKTRPIKSGGIRVCFAVRVNSSVFTLAQQQ